MSVNSTSLKKFRRKNTIELRDRSKTSTDISIKNNKRRGRIVRNKRGKG